VRFGTPGDTPVLVVVNFTPLPRNGYQIGVPHGGRWTERLNSDARVYGGSGVGNFGGVDAEDVEHGGYPARVTITVPPLGAVFLEGRG
jgi:1,4-alpha-glucan branching enzyme